MLWPPKYASEYCRSGWFNKIWGEEPSRGRGGTILTGEEVVSWRGREA